MAIHAPDPHNLRSISERQGGSVIDWDRPCAVCGYNMRGLRIGIQCPECGASTQAPADMDEALSRMPRRIILAFIWGCWVATLCVLAIPVLLVMDRLDLYDHSFTLAGLAGCACIWMCATWMLTPGFDLPQAVFWGFAPRSRVRWISRWCSGGWVVAAGTLIMRLATPSPTPMLDTLMSWGVIVGISAGLAGISALSFLLENLSEWARDDGAYRIFNAVTWGLPLTVIFTVLPVPLPFKETVAIGIWGVLVLMFPFALLMLSKSVTLSMVHSFEYEYREQRRQQRKERYHARVVDQLIAKAPAAKPPAANPPPGTHAPGKQRP